MIIFLNEVKQPKHSSYGDYSVCLSYSQVVISIWTFFVCRVIVSSVTKFGMPPSLL